MITAPLLQTGAAVRHGFFTRRDGASEGPFASLNCGFGSGDDRGRVTANRARALARLGLTGAALVTAHQVHSPQVSVVEEPWQPDAAPEADGLVTKRPGVVLGVLSADCAPVLFADAQAGVVGAAHAGWRGCQAGVLEATVEVMAVMGADTASIRAAVGPCIGQESYEVGGEFYACFIDADAANDDLFVPGGGRGKFHFDLGGHVKRRLEKLGLAGIDVLDFDTCADEDRFFSYRRACLRGDTGYGRGLSAIALAG